MLWSLSTIVFAANTVLSIGNDRTFKMWDLDNLVCLHESPSLGQFCLTASAVHMMPGTGAGVLALGNSEGKVSLFNLKGPTFDSSNKIGDMILNSGKVQQEVIANGKRLCPDVSGVSSASAPITVTSNTSRTKIRPPTRQVMNRLHINKCAVE